eukprot:8355774-Lingulodinium_polyedra.AAC.1
MRALRRPWRPPVGSVRLPPGNNVPAAAICALVEEWAVGYVVTLAPEILADVPEWGSAEAICVLAGGD